MSETLQSLIYSPRRPLVITAQPGMTCARRARRRWSGSSLLPLSAARSTRRAHPSRGIVRVRRAPMGRRRRAACC
eukprot:2000945-Prymnesium_polylepis.2